MVHRHCTFAIRKQKKLELLVWYSGIARASVQGIKALYEPDCDPGLHGVIDLQHADTIENSAEQGVIIIINSNVEHILNHFNTRVSA